MNWPTVIWSMAAGACLTLGVVHLLVWCWDRFLRANLWFAGMAFSIALVALCEWSLMRARTSTEFLELHRWGHVATFLTIIGIVGFVQSYFRTGRPWLAWTVVALRALVVLLAFVPGPTFNYREVTALMPFKRFGETVVAPVAVANPWARLGEASLLLMVGFVVDASFQLWRKNDARQQQRALVVGGGVALFLLVCLTNAILVHTGTVPAPYFISLAFMFIVGAMSSELSRDVMHASHVAESMGLAAGAAQLVMWRWDIPRDVIWVSPNKRGFYGIPPGESINFRRFLETLHADDRAATRETVQQALAGGDLFRAEYRVIMPDGGMRWIGARGKVEFNGDHLPLRMLGVSIDITERKTAELEAAQHRAELTHLARVTTLSELSGSLAHELNQPLAIILSNAQAAQRLLALDPPDVAEVRDILTDIVAEDRRAGEVIKRLRTLLKRGETAFTPLSLNEAIEDVLHLVHVDLIGRGVTAECVLMTDLPAINGDRVQLQQVVLNLVLNAADAMSLNAPGSRRMQLTTTYSDENVRLCVRDEGCGLPAAVEKLFEPFFTTKPHGLGMGLAICRSIVASHGGRLWTEPHAERGAVFHLELPVLQTPPE